MRIIYNGTDIYPEVSVNRCWHDMYAGGQPDELTIRFNDVRRLWDIWQPQIGDVISVEEGAATTGQMYVAAFRPENGFYTLRASALPPAARERHCKSWDDTTFFQLIDELAGAHGLSVERYSVADRPYEYVEQRNADDFEFLQRRCKLEGAAMICYDEKLIVYDENAMESETPIGTLDITAQDDFTFVDDSDDAYTECELCNGGYTGRYSAGGNRPARLLREVMPVYASSQGEMDRWARGILRNANKDAVHCEYYSQSLLDDYAAGSTVNVTTIGAQSWDGAFFITQVRNDYVFLTTKLFMRKPLGW